MKALLTSLLALAAASSLLAQYQEYSVNSPDKKVQVNVRLTDRVYYNVVVDGAEVMWFSPLSMETSQGHWGSEVRLKSSDQNSVNEAIKTVWGIRSQVPNNYNELRLEFEGDYAIHFRAYNDGVAYRFVSLQPGELIVYDEEVEYRFWDDYMMINHVTDSFYTSYEKFYTRQTIQEVPQDSIISLPSVIDQGNIKLAVLEADLYSYPGLYLTKKGQHRRNYIRGTLPKFPQRVEQGGWSEFSLVVKETENYIAKTEGNRSFPWRALEIARSDAELADSDLVYRLSRPSKIKDTSWIQPGMVAWDWWNGWNIIGVDFESGVNNQTYEYYIDFAAKNGIEYVIMDEGWSDQFDVLLPTPQLDMEHLANYAKKRGVRLILWAVWFPLDRQHEEAFKIFEKWGIAGVKVDFIDRDDQLAVEFYERIAKAAADHNLLVDFHGCSKPTGLHRTYPNVVNFEAVRGNEYNKFSEGGVPPGHNLDLVFTRMLAGPMDYTPGAMRNAIQGDFSVSNLNTMSHGTRCHQLGMYVVYYAPLQMMCDAPTSYERYPDILEFCSTVPVSWDETVVLEGELGEYVVIARRKGDDWYVGGMTNWTERTVIVDFSFLGRGAYETTIFQDGVNAHKNAEDYQRVETTVSSSATMEVHMKPGGGFAMKLKK